MSKNQDNEQKKKQIARNLEILGSGISGLRRTFRTAFGFRPQPYRERVLSALERNQQGGGQNPQVQERFGQFQGPFRKFFSVVQESQQQRRQEPPITPSPEEIAEELEKKEKSRREREQMEREERRRKIAEDLADRESRMSVVID